MKKTPTPQNPVKAIGAMSGTSLDGLDLAAVHFYQNKLSWDFEIVAAQTFPYSTDWAGKLGRAHLLNGEELTKLDAEFGNFLGMKIKAFMHEKNFCPEVIASHGHTVFHQPEKGFTRQIGNGSHISAITDCTVVSDFRSLDVALGGQGAPLVPVGDKLLFSEYKYCLNLGGFSNISFDHDGKRIAFDICPVNYALNHYARKEGLAYDKNGDSGRKGKIDYKLLTELNKLPYYTEEPPKSLGREWMENTFFPVIEKYSLSNQDVLKTIYEHIAMQIGLPGNYGKMLVTGGGAFNNFLMERIKAHLNLKITIPGKQLVEYKEALIFALLGLLRLQNKINCYASVTGAKTDSCTGIVVQPV